MKNGAPVEKRTDRRGGRRYWRTGCCESKWQDHCRLLNPFYHALPKGAANLRADASAADPQAYLVRVLSVLLGGLGFKV